LRLTTPERIENSAISGKNERLCLPNKASDCTACSKIHRVAFNLTALLPTQSAKA
jgi:hypothetical protein